MREVSDLEAKERHNVVTRHHQMPNGEYRFRLIKHDGTAYIRTEAGPKGAWQKSQFHNQVKETYLVQKGWIAFASRVQGVRRIAIFREGELFTTQPLVIHNIYMPALSVIHTVKHGNSTSEDRITNSETAEFDKQTEILSTEEEIIMLDERSTAKSRIGELEEKYNVAYRHYDDLIWRVPVWTTGLLTATMVGLNSATQDTLARTTGIAARYISITYVLLTFAVMLAFAFVLHRFRVHQRGVRVEARRSTPIWKSASTMFNILVCTEAFFLMGLAMLMLGVPIAIAVSIPATLSLALAVVYEYLLRK